MTGQELMELALQMRESSNTEAAARWLEAHGVSYELAVLALVGSKAGLAYGVVTSLRADKK